MKLIHFNLTSELLGGVTRYTEWIMESPEVFFAYVGELNDQIAGKEGKFVLSENNKELELSKAADLLINPFSTEVNTRKILNKLYLELTERSREEQMYMKTVELFNHIQEYMLELEQQSSYILDFNRETDVSILLKALSVQYEVKEAGYWERLIQYIKIMASAAGIKVFIFVNLRSYLSDAQMEELIKELEYQDVSGLFIENQQRSCLKGVKWYIIDKDQCEIY